MRILAVNISLIGHGHGGHIHNKNYGPQNYHRDYENFNFVKVFIYLTDVKSQMDHTKLFLVHIR